MGASIDEPRVSRGAHGDRAALLRSAAHFSTLHLGLCFAEIVTRVDALPGDSRARSLEWLESVERATRDLSVRPPYACGALSGVPESLRACLFEFARVAQLRAEANHGERALEARIANPRCAHGIVRTYDEALARRWAEHTTRELLERAKGPLHHAELIRALASALFDFLEERDPRFSGTYRLLRADFESTAPAAVALYLEGLAARAPKRGGLTLARRDDDGASVGAASEWPEHRS